jgi:adenylate kinase
MESDPREVAKTEEDIKEVRERQEINRHYATVYSMMYGAVLKILQVRKGSVTAAVNGLIETMKILL